MNTSVVYEALSAIYGPDCGDWVFLPREKPRWWHRRSRKEERRLLAAVRPLGIKSFSPDMRAAFWREIEIGQATDDAGGFMWRCWDSALRAHRKEDDQ